MGAIKNRLTPEERVSLHKLLDKVLLGYVFLRDLNDFYQTDINDPNQVLHRVKDVPCDVSAAWYLKRELVELDIDGITGTERDD